MFGVLGGVEAWKFGQIGATENSIAYLEEKTE